MKKQNEKCKRLIAAIAAMILLILGDAILIRETCALYVNSIALYGISVDVGDYNDAPVKSNEWTEKISQANEARQNIYNSPDLVVRAFVNLPELGEKLSFGIGFINFVLTATLKLVQGFILLLLPFGIYKVLKCTVEAFRITGKLVIQIHQIKKQNRFALKKNLY